MRKYRDRSLILKFIFFDTKSFLLSCLGAAITCVPWLLINIWLGFFLKDFLDNIQGVDNSFQSFTLLILILIGSRIFIILGYGLNSWYGEKIANKIEQQIIKCWNHRNEDLTDLTVNEGITVLTNDCGESISEFYFQGFGLKILEPLICLIGCAIVLLNIHISVLIYSILIAIAYSIISLRISKNISNIKEKEMQLKDKMSEEFTEVMEGFLTIRQFKLKKSMSNKIKVSSQNINEEYKKMETKEIFITFCSRLLETVNYTGLILICYYLSTKGIIEYSNVIVLFTIQSIINDMMLRASHAKAYLDVVKVNFKRIDAVLNLPQEHDGLDFKIENPEFGLELNHIKLDKNKKTILDIDEFRVKQGEKVALVGASGSGKSTLLKLINGYFTTFDGDIRLFNNELQHVSIKKWREKIGFFEQSNQLFNDTVYNNIKIGNDLANANEINQAYKFSGLSLNSDSPLDLIIEEQSTNLSGGEKQRINLARLSLKDRELYLFDEPTRSLDQMAEIDFIDKIKTIVGDNAMIVVSHREKILEMVDLIYLIDEGRIVEKGSYNDLIKNENSKLYKLFRTRKETL